MKITTFFGGDDVQRSLNLSDNKCINLVPTANNDGTVTGFYKCEGLKQESVLSGIPAGAYKTTTNRSFYVTGTTLYELNSNLTSTSRGTVTSGDYSFSDNGIELICVNGTDGWLLTLADNTLTKIKVLTGEVTITIASPAVISKTAHGLVAGDRIIFTTTGVLPDGISTSTSYYVLSTGLTADVFRISLTSGGAAINTSYPTQVAATFNPYVGFNYVTISNASPAVFTLASHNLLSGDRITLQTDGTLPSPLVEGQNYYVIGTGLTGSEFQVSATDGGSAVNTTTAGSGAHSFTTVRNARANTVDQHGLDFATGIQFLTTGTLPTGLTALTTYYATGIPATWNTVAGTTYLYCADSQIKAGSAVQIISQSSTPPEALSGYTYYLLDGGVTGIGAYDGSYFKLSASLGGTAISLSGTFSATPCRIMKLNSFVVASTSASGFGTIVSFTSSGSGTHTYMLAGSMQSGTHTFTTPGYGFPEGCKTISYMNGRFAACEPNTQNFYVSEVLDGGYWDALNVQTVDSNPDYVTGQVVSHNELIVFCETSGEAFYDSAVIPTPFVKREAFEVGCVAPFSVATIDNTIFWLGNSKEGDGIVYKLNGYTPTRISTFGIEQQIKAFTTKTDAKAFTYQIEGHHFYVLTFPTESKTFVFDLNTNLWHERASFIDGEFGRWEANDFLFFNGTQYVTDYNSTNLYSLDVNTFMNGTNYLKILRTFRTPQKNMGRVIHSKLQLDAEFGTGVIGGDEPVVMLRWSDDLGHTWSNLLNRGIGAVGNYFKYVVWNRLGLTKGQPRIYEISSTSDNKIVLLNVFLD